MPSKRCFLNHETGSYTVEEHIYKYDIVIGKVNGQVNLPQENINLTLNLDNLEQLKEFVNAFPNRSFRVVNREKKVITDGDIESVEKSQEKSDKLIDKDEFLKIVNENNEDANSLVFNSSFQNGKIGHYINDMSEIHMTMELSVVKKHLRIRVVALVLTFIVLVAIIAILQLYLLN